MVRGRHAGLLAGVVAGVAGPIAFTVAWTIAARRSSGSGRGHAIRCLGNRSRHARDHTVTCRIMPLRRMAETPGPPVIFDRMSAKSPA